MQDQIPSYLQRYYDNQKLSEISSRNPELLQPAQPLNFTPDILREIGVDYLPEKLGSGFIKFYPQDFIVEEITSDLQVLSILPSERNIPEMPTTIVKPKLEATVVKLGMGTNECLERLAEALNVPLSSIGYSGMKDAKAITAQRLTLAEVDLEILKNLEIPQVLLKDLQWRNTPESLGNLYGNRFSIFVRTDRSIETSRLQHKLTAVEGKGFPNFFSLQRFGSRLNTHIIGKHILQRHYDKAVRELLISSNEHEFPLFNQLRREAAKSWGDWASMRQVFESFPSYLYNEVVVSKVLEATNGDYLAALRKIDGQTRFWMYAYCSYYFNRLLSVCLVRGNCPASLPLLHSRPDIYELYKDVLDKSEVLACDFRYKDFPTIHSQPGRLIPSHAQVKVWSVLPASGGLVFHFDLRKGSYATGFLNEFFEVYQHRPIPEWVQQDLVDTRAMLGYPGINLTLTALPQFNGEVSVELADL